MEQLLDPMDLLTDDDRAWLDQMADVLPRSMPVDGSSWWQLVRVDYRLLGPGAPPSRPSPTRAVLG